MRNLLKGSIAARRVARRGRRSLAAIAMLCPIAAAAGELSGVVTLASQYVYRGQAVSDGNVAAQLGADYAHDSGFFAGAWGSTIDIENPFSERDTELDFYAGYHHATEGRLAFTGTLIRYTYPGQTSLLGLEYDYTEALAAVTLDGRHSLEFGFADDLYGLGGSGRHWELRSEWPVASAWVLSAGIGRNDLSDYGGYRYLHWDLGASVRLARFTVDLRWYDNEKTGSAIGGVSAGSQLAAAVSLVF
jgi:uncharacterized protein (TIGR02001 family)